MRRFLSSRYDIDHIRRRVEQMVDIDDKKLLVEQLSSFCNDVHQFQVLCRAIASGEFFSLLM